MALRMLALRSGHQAEALGVYQWLRTLRVEELGTDPVPGFSLRGGHRPSLNHRLARSLLLYALCNGWIGSTTTVVEASSGSTAVSEAYFARLIGVPFVAVMSRVPWVEVTR